MIRKVGITTIGWGSFPLYSSVGYWISETDTNKVIYSQRGFQFVKNNNSHWNFNLDGNNYIIFNLLKLLWIQRTCRSRNPYQVFVQWIPTERKNSRIEEEHGTLSVNCPSSLRSSTVQNITMTTRMTVTYQIPDLFIPANLILLVFVVYVQPAQS